MKNIRKNFITILSIIFVFSFINYGCNNTDEYYVRYEVDSSTIYSGVKLDVTIKDEDENNKLRLSNNYTIITRKYKKVKFGIHINI